MTFNLQAIAEASTLVQQRRSPQTKGGWQEVVRAEPATSDILTFKQYKSMSVLEQKISDQQRMLFHSGIDAIATTAFTGAIEALEERFSGVLGNSHVALPGMLLTGPAHVGKSTVIINFGREVEKQFRAAHKMPLAAAGEPVTRQPNGHEYLPVCYFRLDPQVLPTLRNAVRFYNPDLPARTRYTVNDLTAILLENIAECGTRLIVLDQMQNLRHAIAGADAVSEALKNIMDGAPGTMVTGAGVGLDTFRVFTEGHQNKDAHLAQTGSRFALHHMNSYNIENEESRKDWIRLLTTVEKSLVLYNAQPKDITDHAQYLYEVTGGLPGGILPLLRNTANNAITTKTERITLELLQKNHESALMSAAKMPARIGAAQPVARKPRRVKKATSNQFNTTPAQIAVGE